MKYRFEIVYSPMHFQEACNFLKKCDMDIGDVGLKHTMTFTSTTIHEIESLKELIIKAYESDGCKVLHIEGGDD